MAADENKDLYGLIGFPLGHSFSRGFFQKKFKNEGIRANYENLPLAKLTKKTFAALWQNPNLKGLNVTIPHKQTVMPFLDEVEDRAVRIRAVNTIKRTAAGKLKGFNTDYIGFKKSLTAFLTHQNLTALVLGTGGAAKAVAVVLQDLKIDYKLVSRQAHGSRILTYETITPDQLSQYRLIINTTPLGMSPKLTTFPPLPYQALTPQHFLYDLVYNPEATAFLKHGQKAGAKTKNGLEMLYGQAEASWAIWNGTSS